MTRGTRAIVLALILMVATMAASVALPSMAGADDGDVQFLLDRGNGDTEWTCIDGDGTVAEAIAQGLDSMGLDHTIGDGITVDGVGTVTVGTASSGGSFSETGSTGVTTTVSWRAYVWEGSGWSEVSPDDPTEGAAVALGYYPEGYAPTVDPDHMYAWTMSRGDAANSGAQTSDIPDADGYDVEWTVTGTAHANMLYADGLVYQKFGIRIGVSNEATLACIDPETGEALWTFTFVSGANYESSTPLIVGDSIYVATMTGYIYRIPLSGPGDDNEHVTSFGGVPLEDAVAVPSGALGSLTGYSYNSGFSSMIYSNGAIYVTHSNGMVYCLDLDLNLIWSYLMGGSTYLVSPTLVDGRLYVGALDGHMYIFDALTGECLVDELVYQVDIMGSTYGNVGQMVVHRQDDGTYRIYATVSDGRGMSQTHSGMMVYSYDPSDGSVGRLYLDDALGTMGRYVLSVETEEFSGIYVLISDGISTSLYRIGADLDLELMTSGLEEIHSAMVLVNGEYIFAQSYSSADPIYQISLDGTIVATAEVPSGVRNYNMVSLLLIDGHIFGGTDTGIYALSGAFVEYVHLENSAGMPVIGVLALIVLVMVLVMAAVYCILRFGRGVDRPFEFIWGRVRHYLYGDDISHNTRSRHRLRVVLAIGAVLAILSFTLCLCVGATAVLSPVDAYSALFSAIAKGGVGLDAMETTVFVSRLPRTVAALAVGIGLSVAGCIYQAIIRNPLVDPYIMGVSSGAGVAAIAVIAFDFTFFGVFSEHSIFLTAIAACIGGLVAFGCTMLLAERAGGSSTNYVLAGVVVGLAFSAVQTLMLTMAGNRLSNALSWLYGSFAEVTWSQVGVVLFLSLFLSLVPLLWAKEFNLVLLGEDQAREMGLDVRRFNRLMLILASVLTSVCVAFCGVIGFVGLVIPHLCRMILGSDHRMVLPASICFGGTMLMLADLLARTGYYGMELPVGAITTVIGIPVFAYLLIKRGRMYDG